MSGAVTATAGASVPAVVARVPWPSAEELARDYPARPVVMLRVGGRRRACLALLLPAEAEAEAPLRGLIVTDDLGALVDGPVGVDPGDILRRFDVLPHPEVVAAWHAFDAGKVAPAGVMEGGHDAS